MLKMQFDIRRFDIYRKVPKDLTQPTFTGAFISICSCAFMIYLFISELMFFITPEIASQLIVDDPVSHNERIPVSLDITLHKMDCKFVGLDLQDDLGRHEVGMVDNIKRSPINNGVGCRFRAGFTINKAMYYINDYRSKLDTRTPASTTTTADLEWTEEPTVGYYQHVSKQPAEHDLSVTLDAIEAMYYINDYRSKLDTRTPASTTTTADLEWTEEPTVGYYQHVSKQPAEHDLSVTLDAIEVPGNFHVSTHSSPQQPSDPDMSHTIHQISFGDQKPDHSNIPGSFNPLSAVHKSDSKISHDYFMKVVPTVYESKSEPDVYPFQYTFAYRTFSQITGNRKSSPAIWFRYEVSPITVKYIETTKPFYSFLTTVCAIIGGTFTVAGIIDSALFTASELFRKVQLGKVS